MPLVSHLCRTDTLASGLPGPWLSGMPDEDLVAGRQCGRIAMDACTCRRARRVTVELKLSICLRLRLGVRSASARHPNTHRRCHTPRAGPTEHHCLRLLLSIPGRAIVRQIGRHCPRARGRPPWLSFKIADRCTKSRSVSASVSHSSTRRSGACARCGLRIWTRWSRTARRRGSNGQKRRDAHILMERMTT
ncbi:hypothetical protein DAEQUDRAFT_385503 [Daedalea quercina L-15889]|uniref:Uncharacterized protein n=1 Tax=Daedalea quercina L-15889 TaxID=1314783 RepID=A0A165P1Z6_9APHY|nr:hypothetical protein DAEQUDRAFT_385503 [Daedalea quercina L-15889]